MRTNFSNIIRFGKNKYIIWSDVYSEFENWFEFNFPGTLLPKRAYIKCNLEKYIGNLDNKWSHLEFINPEK